MRRDSPREVPAVWLYLVRLASWIVPARVRSAWRQTREEEARHWWLFLHERGDNTPEARGRVLRHCWRAFSDAFRERLPTAGFGDFASRTARGPWFVLAVLSSAFLAILAGTGFLAAIRLVYAPLPFPAAGRLVACYQVHFLSASLGAQIRYLRPWRKESRTIDGLAAYHVRTFRVDQAVVGRAYVTGAQVTPDFFQVLGARALLGRTLGPDDDPSSSRVVLSYRLWRSAFSSDKQVLTRPLTLDGQTVHVVGVLPPEFWFRSPELDVWTLMPEAAGQAPRIVGLVGRLKPGVTVRQARAELDGIALRTPGIRGGALRVVPLAEHLRPSLGFTLGSFLVGVGLALAIALVQSLRATWKGNNPLGETLGYWAFFFVKPALLLASLAALGAELSAWNVLSFHPAQFVLSLVADWLALLGTLLVFRWSILDQSRRCPVCLRRLSTPVTSGSWSSVLLEPASTELLCDQGHGTLLVSSAYSTLGEIRRWITLEDSWRDVTTAGGGRDFQARQ